MVGVEFEVREDNVEAIKESYQRAHARVSFTVPYARFVEFGSAPHTPPFDAIKGWTRRNWGRIWPQTKEASLSDGMRPNSPAHVEAAARVVWGAIRKNGTRARLFGTRTVQDARQGQAARIAQSYQGSDDLRAPERIVNDLGDWMLNRSKDILVSEGIYDLGNLYQSGSVEYEVDENEEAVSSSLTAQTNK